MPRLLGPDPDGAELATVRALLVAPARPVPH